MNLITDALAVLPILKRYIYRTQLKVMCENMAGEEGQFFIDKMVEMAGIIREMPELYSQDGMGTQAVVRMHYFTGDGCDWHLTEIDSQDGTAFGLCDLGMGFPELGTVSIQELVENGAELDLYWEPKTLAEVMK